MKKLAILACAFIFSYIDLHATTFEPVHSTDTLAKNIAGDVPEEVIRLIAYLQDPRIRQRYKDFGVDLYKGLLFTGKPGTGKTALAKAIAGKTQAPFFSAIQDEKEYKKYCEDCEKSELNDLIIRLKKRRKADEEIKQFGIEAGVQSEYQIQKSH